VEPLIQPPEELRRLLARVAWRLRLRHGMQGAIVGLWVGIALAAVVVVLSKFTFVFLSPWILAAIAVGAGALAGGIIGGAMRLLDDTGRALLVDKGLQTREQIVSALEASRTVLTDDVSDLNETLVHRGRALAAELDPATAVPLWRRRWLRHLLAQPLGGAAVIGMLFIPAFTDGTFRILPGQDPEVVEEGQQLQERIEEILEQGEQQLPEEIQEQLEKLAESLQNEELTPEEAREKIEELQDELAEFQEELAEQSEADELQQAAEELAQSEVTEDLGEALQEPDFEKAAQEAEKLAEKMQQASAAEQQAAAGAMERASQALAESNPELSKQLSQAAQQMQQMAEQQGSSGQNQDGMTQEQMQQLAEQLQQMQQEGLAEQLKQDQELMKMSQRLNGALESSS